MKKSEFIDKKVKAIEDDNNSHLQEATKDQLSDRKGLLKKDR